MSNTTRSTRRGILVYYQHRMLNCIKLLRYIESDCKVLEKMLKKNSPPMPHIGQDIAAGTRKSKPVLAIRQHMESLQMRHYFTINLGFEQFRKSRGKGYALSNKWYSEPISRFRRSFHYSSHGSCIYKKKLFYSRHITACVTPIRDKNTSTVYQLEIISISNWVVAKDIWRKFGNRVWIWFT